jgi:hypothetical protein
VDALEQSTLRIRALLLEPLGDSLHEEGAVHDLSGVAKMARSPFGDLAGLELGYGFHFSQDGCSGFADLDVEERDSASKDREQSYHSDGYGPPWKKMCVGGLWCRVHVCFYCWVYGCFLCFAPAIDVDREL